MARDLYQCQAKLFLYPSEYAAWHFLVVDSTTSDRIRTGSTHSVKGFGSVPVTVIIGNTTFETSIFWSAREKQYLLPVKAKVRQLEQLEAGDRVDFSFVVRTS